MFHWLSFTRVLVGIIPFSLTLIFLLLDFVPTYIPKYSEIAPILPLISIYHWAIYKPSLLPGWLIFIFGILYDSLLGTPLGLHSLIFLSVYLVVLFQRRFIIGKSFLIYWLGYAIICSGAAFEGWFLLSLWHLSLIGIEAIFFQTMLSLGIFPIISWLTLKVQLLLMRSEKNAS